MDSFLVIVCVFLLCSAIVHCKAVENNTIMAQNEKVFKDELVASMNQSSSVKLEEQNWFEPRKKQSTQGKQNLLEKIIPMLAIPFITQTIMLPMMLLGLKFMLLQSILLGKMAIIFWSVNLIRNMMQDQQGQFYSHNVHIGHQ